MPTESSNTKSRILNYLLWLEERGFSHDRPMDYGTSYHQRLTETELVESADCHNVSPDAGNLSDSSYLKLLVLAEGLESADQEMLMKILKALSVESSQFRLRSSITDSYSESFKEACILILGRESATHRNSTWDNTDLKQNELVYLQATGQYVLLISHPKAMRNNPELKRDAWTGLQKLKAVLSALTEKPSK